MRQALRAAAANPVHYERRRPEETTLYRVVQEHLETFLAEVEAGGAASLPQFVKDEFDAFLECGILAHGFLRVRCAECGHEKLVAFSCKRRGICPSCGARRMAETAAWLVDHVIPKVPVRQWVLSFPIPLRSLFAVHPELLAPVLQIIHRVIAFQSVMRNRCWGMIFHCSYSARRSSSFAVMAPQLSAPMLSRWGMSPDFTKLTSISAMRSGSPGA